jgi:hypothetical protein
VKGEVMASSTSHLLWVIKRCRHVNIKDQEIARSLDCSVEGMNALVKWYQEEYDNIDVEKGLRRELLKEDDPMAKLNLKRTVGKPYGR